jgi:hypothetical protein
MQINLGKIKNQSRLPRNLQKEGLIDILEAERLVSIWYT